MFISALAYLYARVLHYEPRKTLAHVVPPLPHHRPPSLAQCPSPMLLVPGIKLLFPSHFFLSQAMSFSPVSPLNTQFSLIVTQTFVACIWPTFYLPKAAEKLFKSLIINLAIIPVKGTSSCHRGEGKGQEGDAVLHGGGSGLTCSVRPARDERSAETQGRGRRKVIGPGGIRKEAK